MLLRQKKTQGEEQNWCVILSPIASELDKKKVAQKLSSVFSLTPDEATDLVANTPIILLDNLTRVMAAKLREYFRTAAGAETVLTNDSFQKRKCYRTVWPEPPNLSFLHNWNPLEEVERHEALRPEEALDEIRTLSQGEKKMPQIQPSLTSVPLLSRAERDQLLEETERWRKESLMLRQESQNLKDQLEKFKKENLFQETGSEENRALLEAANGKYAALREEYANARRLYEEKIAALLHETEQAKRKAQDIAEKMEMLQRAKQELERSVSTQAEQITFWHNRHDTVAPKLAAIEKKLEEEKVLRERVELRQKDLEKSQMRLMQELEEKTAALRDWELRGMDFDKQMVELRESYQNQEKMLQNNFRQLEMRERELEIARRQVREMNAQVEQRDALQKRAQLAGQLVEKEAVLKKLVKDQEKIEAEIREREEAMRLLLSQQESVEKEIVEAKQAQRHLSEIAKRDQKGRIRIGGRGPQDLLGGEVSGEESPAEND